MPLAAAIRRSTRRGPLSGSTCARQVPRPLDGSGVLQLGPVGYPLVDDLPRLAHPLAVQQQPVFVPQVRHHVAAAHLHVAARATHADTVFQPVDQPLQLRKGAGERGELTQVGHAAHLASPGDERAQEPPRRRSLAARGRQEDNRGGDLRLGRQAAIVQQRPQRPDKPPIQRRPQADGQRQRELSRRRIRLGGEIPRQAPAPCRPASTPAKASQSAARCGPSADAIAAPRDVARNAPARRPC